MVHKSLGQRGRKVREGGEEEEDEREGGEDEEEGWEEEGRGVLSMAIEVLLLLA